MAAGSESTLEELVTELDITPARFQKAIRSYTSVGEWLNRPTSSLRRYEPEVYPQGSFALNTVVRPVNEADEYDVDLVCELNGRTKQQLTQEKLRNELHAELKAYADAKGMKEPEPKRRCWRLNYADGAQFHLDALPALPDGQRQRLLLEGAGLDAAWSDDAIAITDTEHRSFRMLGEDWPASNPRGYQRWFRSRMQKVFEARRAQIALNEHAAVHKIPEERVKTPLHRAVQLLKRHRDTRFIDRPEEKPISIIITTLAARCYQNETTIEDALRQILTHMDVHIEQRQGQHWIRNPTDPRENFADKWAAQPGLASAFHEWLEYARADFQSLLELSGRALLEHAAPVLGEGAATRAGARLPGGLRAGLTSWSLFKSKHREAPPWRLDGSSRVSIAPVQVERKGWQTKYIVSNAPALAKGTTLRFEAHTDVTPPYRVYWQVVNTGDEARDAGKLRGGFDEGRIEQGHIRHSETAQYSGTHSIECFIVKNNLLAARSGAFVVNVA